MTQRHWQIELDQQVYNIRLEHSPWIGKRRIWLNEQLVHEGRRFFERGSYYHLPISGHVCDVEIIPGMFNFGYVLFVDGEAVLAIEYQRKQIRGALKARLDEYVYWQELARLMGLRLVQDAAATGIWRYNLIGARHGFLISIRYGQTQEPVQPVFLVIIRHTAMTEAVWKQFKQQLEHALSPLSRQEKRMNKQWTATELSTWIPFPYLPGKQTTTEVAARLNQLFDALSDLATPSTLDTCDGLNCTHKTGVPLQLVVVEAVPFLLCSLCLNGLAESFERVEREYESQPTNTSQLILPGLGIAFLGGLLWAAVALALDRLIVLTGPAIFIALAGLAYWLRVRFSGWVVILMTLLTVLSVVWGVYVMGTVVAIQRWPDTLMLQDVPRLFKIVTQALMGDPRILNVALFLGLVPVVPYALSGWWQHRVALKRRLQPHIFVVGGNSF